MANPNVPQGTLNRIKASLIWVSFPALNLTPSYLGEEMFRVNFTGEVTTTIRTATGVVQSPEPYQMVEVRAQLVRSQALADSYKAQIGTNALLGDATFRPDIQTSGLSPFEFLNGTIAAVEPLNVTGKDASWTLSFTFYWLTNSSLWG